ncbi:MAG: hypothetical protein AB2A00_02675 [Myxococcota bacterium]
MVADAEWAIHAARELARAAGELEQVRRGVHQLLHLATDAAQPDRRQVTEVLVDTFEQRRHLQLLQRHAETLDRTCQQAVGACVDMMRLLERGRADATVAWSGLKLARGVRHSIHRLQQHHHRDSRRHVDAQMTCFRRIRAIADGKVPNAEAAREQVHAELAALVRTQRAAELRYAQGTTRVARRLLRGVQTVAPGRRHTDQR